MLSYADVYNKRYVHQMVSYNLTCKMSCHGNKETFPHVGMATYHTHSLYMKMMHESKLSTIGFSLHIALPANMPCFL